MSNLLNRIWSANSDIFMFILGALSMWGLLLISNTVLQKQNMRIEFRFGVTNEQEFVGKASPNKVDMAPNVVETAPQQYPDNSLFNGMDTSPINQ